MCTWHSDPFQVVVFISSGDFEQINFVFVHHNFRSSVASVLDKEFLVVAQHDVACKIRVGWRQSLAPVGDAGTTRKHPTMRAGGLGGTRRVRAAVPARSFVPFRELVRPPSR